MHISVEDTRQMRYNLGIVYFNLDLLGDIAQYTNGYYRILGRASADIIKSGGYKISALQIETELLAHPLIADCAVVGLNDEVWGQKVLYSYDFVIL